MSAFIDRTGEIHITNEGYPVKIIKYINSNDCNIQFEDGTIIYNRSYASVRLGGIKKPVNRLGEVHVSNEGDIGTIIEYNSSTDIILMFEDGNVSKPTRYADIIRGEFQNPYKRTVCGVGYKGIGKYNYKDYKKVYVTWNSMLNRCYGNNERNMRIYKDISVCKEWECLQNFGAWFEENHNSEKMLDWDLDKDLLIRDSKIYSPDTCCFLPSEINKGFTKSNKSRGKYSIGVYFDKKRKKFAAQLRRDDLSPFLGYFNTSEEAFQAYKIAKEEYLKKQADKYRDALDIRAYKALYNYEVKITD